ncbi:MAG: hypothetical protein AAF234_15925 [Pseudomonadota bacterium]
MTAKTTAALNTQADTTLADNTNGDISEGDVRTMSKDLADSMVNGKSTKALEVGYTATPPSALVISSGTHVPDPTLGNIQDVTFNGAFTFDPPATAGSYAMRYDVLIGASAGAVTFEASVLVDGDDLSTTDGDRFRMWIDKGFGATTIFIKALQ